MSNVTALVRFMLELRAEKRSGVLSVQCGEPTTSIFMRDGELVFAEDGRAATGQKNPVRWTMMRVLQWPGELTWKFAAGDGNVERAGAVAPIVIEEIVLDAVRWVDDDVKNDLGLFAALGQKFTVRPEDRAAIARRFALGRDEADFLGNFDGKRTLGEVLANSGAVDGPALLTALVMTNAFVRPEAPRILATPQPPPRDTPPPMSIRRPVVESAPEASPPPAATSSSTSTSTSTSTPKTTTPRAPEVAAAGPSSARAPWWGNTPNKRPSGAIPSVTASAAPPAPPPSAGRIPTAPPSSGRMATAPPAHGASGPQSTRASAVNQALEARRVSGANLRVPTPSPEAKASAEREFRAALAFFKEFKYGDASQGFARASKLLPGNAEYRLYAKWTAVLHKPGPMQTGDRGDAWRLALAVIAADNDSAFANYVAGAVAQEDGKHAIAQRYLSRAVQLDPQLMDAQRRLRIVERSQA